MKERDTLRINECGHLEIGGCDTVELARKYGTPLYVMDEAYIRKIARGYTDIMNSDYGDGLVVMPQRRFPLKRYMKYARAKDSARTSFRVVSFLRRLTRAWMQITFIFTATTNLLSSWNLP